MSKIASFFILMLTISCTPKETATSFYFRVTEVRETSRVNATDTNKDGGEALLGAAIGHYVAGGPGAVIGAAVGANDGVSSKIVIEPIGCLFKAQANNGFTVTFSLIPEAIGGSDKVIRCTLLRPGDTVVIIQMQRDGQTWYTWDPSRVG